MIRSRHIYVLGMSDNPVKIGIAARITNRLSELQVACPDELILHGSVLVPPHLASRIESATHQHFAEHHRRGEWFNVHKDVALDVARRIARDHCDDHAASVRAQTPDVISRLTSRYPIDVGGRAAVRFYLDRKETPLGAADVARMDAVLYKKCGPVSHKLFKMVFGQNRCPDELFSDLGLNGIARERAEASLAKAVNVLAEYAAWCREERLRKAMLAPPGFYRAVA